MSGLTGFLGAAYDWVKAAHVTFVIFWMAGLFLLPRFYVYHHATTPGSAEDRAWIEREDRVRTIILMPAMLAVWLLGSLLAVDNSRQVLGAHWFSAKLILVVGLSAYQGWLGVYGKRLASGKRPLENRTLRIMNEVPGIAAALIVVLVIVRPF
ncbi:MAG: CopD family protein [Sphingomicrobium sp.]